MKSRIFILVMLAAIIALPSCKKKTESEIAVTVQFSVGDAKIVSAGGAKAASTGAVVSFDDSIVTGAASAVDLNFGTRGVIRITENSNVKMSALQADQGNEPVQFEMKKGKILVIMSKLSKETSFRVTTPTTIVAVRGTSFMVVSDPKTSRVSVLKGRVLVQLAREGKLAENIEKMLEANKKVVVSEELVNEIVAGKKQIEVVALNPKEISEIKEQMKDIKVSDKLDQEAQKELMDLTRDTKAKSDATMKKNQETPKKEIQSIPSI